MDLADQSLKVFLDELGSDHSTPGGGGAAALVGANAAGLVAMVARLTLKHPEYIIYRAQLEEISVTADKLREQLRLAIDADAQAFGSLMSAYKLPKTNADEKQTRSQAIQTGLRVATDSPLYLARMCANLADLALRLVEIGNPHTVSDAGAAALLAEAALKSALLQARINLKSLKDLQFVAATRQEIETLEQHVAQQREQAYKLTLAKLD